MSLYASGSPQYVTDCEYEVNQVSARSGKTAAALCQTILKRHWKTKYVIVCFKKNISSLSKNISPFSLFFATPITLSNLLKRYPTPPSPDVVCLHENPFYKSNNENVIPPEK